ncbi:FGF [Spodoptera litura nucleopolyhedrovirus II]|uniref:FGF n=1 Tax=Spodoptera litura nucleopolyhedrovirus II TaxID=566270 RepID=UPI00018745D6|nr:FGF [Spodoptera litura nucleopolyhedrovirus II]ACI47408.1 FGF [Spodoptera litura nucleopolyhedrovirus II]
MVVQKVVVSLLLLMVATATVRALPIGNVSDAPLRIGTQNHVHIYLNHYLLQMNANGTVDGAFDAVPSNQTLWHRIARPHGLLLLRSSRYCNYLCINECGYGYTALLPNSECLWSEIYDEFNNRFIVKQFENNRTAYLALNTAGKLKRVVLLKKEKLMDAYEQAHVFIKNPTTESNFTESCNPLNTKKLSYTPPKTCKNPPRHKTKKAVTMILESTTPTTPRVEETVTEPTTPRVEETVTEPATMKVVSISSPLPIIPESIIREVFNISSTDTINTNVSDTSVSNTTEENNKIEKNVVINATIVNRMDGKPEISNEVIPVMGADEVVYLDATMTNKTKEGAIPKNFYYHDEEFSIRTLSTKEDVVVKKKSSVSNSKRVVEDVKESIENVISKLIAAGNSTSAAVPTLFVHHTTTLKFCFV